MPPKAPAKAPLKKRSKEAEYTGLKIAFFPTSYFEKKKKKLTEIFNQSCDLSISGLKEEIKAIDYVGICYSHNLIDKNKIIYHASIGIQFGNKDQPQWVANNNISNYDFLLHTICTGDKAELKKTLYKGLGSLLYFRFIEKIIEWMIEKDKKIIISYLLRPTTNSNEEEIFLVKSLERYGYIDMDNRIMKLEKSIDELQKMVTDYKKSTDEKFEKIETQFKDNDLKKIFKTNVKNNQNFENPFKAPQKASSAKSSSPAASPTAKSPAASPVKKPPPTVKSPGKSPANPDKCIDETNGWKKTDIKINLPGQGGNKPSDITLREWLTYWNENNKLYIKDYGHNLNNCLYRCLYHGMYDYFCFKNKQKEFLDFINNNKKEISNNNYDTLKLIFKDIIQKEINKIKNNKDYVVDDIFGINLIFIQNEKELAKKDLYIKELIPSPNPKIDNEKAKKELKRFLKVCINKFLRGSEFSPIQLSNFVFNCDYELFDTYNINDFGNLAIKKNKNTKIIFNETMLNTNKKCLISLYGDDTHFQLLSVKHKNKYYTSIDYEKKEMNKEWFKLYGYYKKFSSMIILDRLIPDKKEFDEKNNTDYKELVNERDTYTENEQPTSKISPLASSAPKQPSAPKKPSSSSSSSSASSASKPSSEQRDQRRPNTHKDKYGREYKGKELEIVKLPPLVNHKQTLRCLLNDGNCRCMYNWSRKNVDGTTEPVPCNFKNYNVNIDLESLNNVINSKQIKLANNKIIKNFYNNESIEKNDVTRRALCYKHIKKLLRIDMKKDSETNSYSITNLKDRKKDDIICLLHSKKDTTNTFFLEKNNINLCFKDIGDYFKLGTNQTYNCKLLQYGDIYLISAKKDIKAGDEFLLIPSQSRLSIEKDYSQKISRQFAFAKK